MGDRVSSLGSSVFEHCDALESAELSIALREIPSAAFKECGKLAEIIIPYYVTSIGDYAFNKSPGW